MAIDIERERAALDWFEERREEYLSALAHAEARQLPDQVAELAQTLAPFLQRRSYWRDGEQVLASGLQAARELGDTAVEARMLDGLGTVHRLQSQWKTAEDEFQRALDAFGRVEDVAGQASALSNLGLVFRKLGRTDNAIEAFEHSIELWEKGAEDLPEHERQMGLARAVNNLGMALRDARREAAAECFQRALVIRQKIGDADGVSRTLNNIGQLAHRDGDLEAAVHAHEQALDIRIGLGDSHGVARTEGHLAKVYADVGRYEDAMRLLDDAFAIRTQLGDRYGEAEAAMSMAVLETRTEQLDRALGTLDHASTIATELGDDLLQGRVLTQIGEVRAAAGDYDGARETWKRALGLLRGIGAEDVAHDVEQRLR